MNASSVNPLHDTVRWLAAHTLFPASRLEPRAEVMLCMAALAAGENETESQRFLVKSRDIAKDAALRAHAQRRSHAHFKSDNSAKV
jgi:hypothetical protein